MSMTDPVADLLTRVRNALMVNHEEVDVPCSRLKEGLAAAMVQAGYLRGYKKMESGPQATLRLYLKYGPEGQHIIHELKRVSRPGGRVYLSAGDIRPVRDGVGIAIVSTSKGVFSDQDCRKSNMGGEVLCTIW